MISVVIPCREHENAYTTLYSLAGQTLQPSQIIVVPDEGRGACWARNRGLELVTTPLVLFSDNDIVWEYNALDILYRVLQVERYASYAYGSYYLDGKLIGDQEFNADLLRQRSYISTMSLCWVEDFPGFDESLERLQDWDLYLTYLENGCNGVYCGTHCFSTVKRKGISFGGQDWNTSVDIIKRKHKL